MTQLNNPGRKLEKFCKTAIEQRLGDISGLPKEVDYTYKEGLSRFYYRLFEHATTKRKKAGRLDARIPFY